MKLISAIDLGFPSLSNSFYLFGFQFCTDELSSNSKPSCENIILEINEDLKSFTFFVNHTALLTQVFHYLLLEQIISYFGDDFPKSKLDILIHGTIL